MNPSGPGHILIGRPFFLSASTQNGYHYVIWLSLPTERYVPTILTNIIRPFIYFSRCVCVHMPYTLMEVKEQLESSLLVPCWDFQLLLQSHCSS